MKELYPYIFKRKSFHLFRGVKGEISKNELDSINEYIKNLKPLYENIKTHIEIVSSEQVSSAKSSEYCILFYSQKEEGYLQNIGYIGEQLDLFLSSLDIGTLWYGFGKVKETKHEDLDYVIMICFAKFSSEDFRKDMFKSKRKEVEEIWYGSNYLDVANIVRFSPSACNSQPWIVEVNDNQLDIYRKKPSKIGLIPPRKMSYYNQIDIGIFILFLEVCLDYNCINYQKELFAKTNENKIDKYKNVTYYIK